VAAEGLQYQVYVNEEDLETRRERLRMQHEAGVHHQHQYEGSPTKRPPQQGRVERRTLVQPVGHHHHARSQSESVATTTRGAQQEDVGTYRSTRPIPELVGVQAPGRVNLEEIQAQTRSTSGAASQQVGWEERLVDLLD
jgi:hypothetical protein